MSTGKDLVPLLAEMPDPQDLRRAIRDALETAYRNARVALGDIHVPEDTYALQRSLGAVRERFDEYATAFRDGLKRIGTMQSEMLVEAVGEQDGVPNQGLTIPDREGDIALGLDTANAYTFDLDQIIAVVVRACALTHDDTDEYGERCIRAFLELGKFEPQVTKVNAYAKQVARNASGTLPPGLADTLSAVVTGAVRKRSMFKGIKFERKKP